MLNKIYIVGTTHNNYEEYDTVQCMLTITQEYKHMVTMHWDPLTAANLICSHSDTDNITNKQTNLCDSILGIFILYGYMSQSDMDNLTNKTNSFDSNLSDFLYMQPSCQL